MLRATSAWLPHGSQRTPTSALIFALCAAIAFGSGCAGSSDGSGGTNDIETSDSNASDSAGDTTSAGLMTKVDILWVIDSSPSMVQEQRALARGFVDFTKKLKELGSVDVQVAVTTMQQVPDKADVFVVGRFGHNAATSYPPNAAVRALRPCTDDASCTQSTTATLPQNSAGPLCSASAQSFPPLSGAIDWTCQHPSGGSKNTVNGNCSLNTSCRAHCTDVKTHKDCRDAFEPGVPVADQRVRCVVPGGGFDTSNAVCVFPPETEGCPAAAELPAILAGDDLALFRCNASVGSMQTSESTFEGGLRSAWMALDPLGPNCDFDACVAHLRHCCDPTDPVCKDANPSKCDAGKAKFCEPLKAGACQNKAFVRDDALLVVVFVSDDDDCSVMPGLNPLDPKVASKETWSSCQHHGDADASNTALNDGNCEFQRSTDASIVCPSDCVAGSTSKDAAGALKCADGCADGSDAQNACLAAATAKAPSFAKTWNAIAPIETYKTLLQGLKPKADALMVVALVGDSVATTPSARHVERTAYYASVLALAVPGTAPYICATAMGEASPGTRYVALAQSLGSNGLVHNLCSADQLSGAMTAIVDAIGARLKTP